MRETLILTRTLEEEIHGLSNRTQIVDFFVDNSADLKDLLPSDIQGILNRCLAIPSGNIDSHLDFLLTLMTLCPAGELKEKLKILYYSA